MVFRLSRDQCRAADRYAIEKLGIPGTILMENAGRNAADRIAAWLRRQAGASGRTGRAVIVCGKGNNGGDGLVIARHLANRGYQVHVDLLAAPEQLTGDAALNHAIVRNMRIPIRSVTDPPSLKRAVRQWKQADVLVDAILGTGFRGVLEGFPADVVAKINSLDKPLIVAIDIPSGLDADAGVTGPAVRADHTITFIAEKTSFGMKPCRAFLGRIHVADIGVAARVLLQ